MIETHTCNSRTAQTMILPDDRRLGFAEYGAPGGAPLIFFHGFPASRLEAALIADAAETVGFRVVAVDRPGYGLSDPQPRRRVVDIAEDIVALTEQLGFDKFTVLGISGGGPYALACACTMPGKLNAVGVVGGLGPVDRPWAVAAMAWPARLGFTLAQRSPMLLRMVYGGVNARLMRACPQIVQSLLTVSAPAADTRVLKRPAVKTALQASFREALRGGAHGALSEFAVLTSAWGFEIADITFPIHLWHGDDDALVPRLHLEYQARHLARARAVYLPREGHFSLPIDHAAQILEVLKQAPGSFEQ